MYFIPLPNSDRVSELDVRTAIDTREYFEVGHRLNQHRLSLISRHQLPAFLFSTLSWAVWLSFFRIGSHHILPTTWPLIWVGLATVTLLNPFPLFFRSSRYWLVKNTLRLLIPGVSRVEFTDFWLGDQFCSLVFSLAHIFTFGCAYFNKWHDVFGYCGSGKHWPTPFVLLALPYFVRLIQSVRRYHDSKLSTHLINVRFFLRSFCISDKIIPFLSGGEIPIEHCDVYHVLHMAIAR